MNQALEREQHAVAGVDQRAAPDARPAATGVRPAARDWGLIRIALVGVLAAILIRVALLPTAGFRTDLDVYVGWVHDLSRAPLGEAYWHTNAYFPVMVYIFAALAAVEPAFRTVVTAADPWIRVLMKLPATLADLGLAICVLYALRERPRQAVLAAIAVLLTPALWYLSAWWGQFDSIYMLAALVAYLLAISGRPVPAAVALGVTLMVKPQALPFLVPFAAWILARHGARTGLVSALALVATVIALWLPFLPDGGPAEYARGLALLPATAFNVISFQAWNAWWIGQQFAGRLLWLDSGVLAGPITFRLAGYVLAGVAELVVFIAVLRRPTARALALGLACATLLAFAFLTTMHERYSVAALAFLAPLLPDRQVRWLWTGLAVTISANIIAAIPASSAVAGVLPANGAVGVVGSVAMLALTAWCLVLLVREPVVSGVPAFATSTEPGGASPDGAAGTGGGVGRGAVALYARYREKVLYLVFGGWNTLFGYGVWAIMQHELGGRLPYLVVLLLAWPIAVLNAYVAYRYFVFRSHGPVLTELPRFSLVYVLTLLVNLALLPVALHVLPLSIYVVQALFLAVVVVCSYLAHRYFSFGRGRGAGASHPTSDGDAASGGLPDVR